MNLDELDALNSQPELARAAPVATPATAPDAALSLADLDALNAAESTQSPSAPSSGPAYDNAGRVYVSDGFGRVGTVDPNEVTDGTQFATREQVQAAIDAEEYGDLGSQVAAGAEGVAQGATLGLYGLAVDAVAGEEYARERALREQHNPVTSTAGNIVGAVAPALLTGGATAAESGASLGARALAYTPAAVVERVGARAGTAAAKYFGGGTAARIGGAAVAGAVEGGLSDAAMTATSGGDPLEVLSSFGRGAAFGGAAGAVLSGVSEGLGAAAQRFDDFAESRKAASIQQEIDALHTADSVSPDVAGEQLVVHQSETSLDGSDAAIDLISNEVAPIVDDISKQAATKHARTVEDLNNALPKLDETNARTFVDDLKANASKTARERLAAQPMDELEALRASRGELDDELDEIAREIERRRNRMLDAMDRIDTDNGVRAKLEEAVMRTQAQVPASAPTVTAAVNRLKGAIAETRATYGDAALAADGGSAALIRVQKQIEHAEPRVAQFLAEGNLAKAYGELDQLKRITQKTAAKVRNREVQLMLREKSEEFRQYLMDVKEWGPVARLQQEFNATWSERFLKSGDSDVQRLNKRQSNERAIDLFDTADRVDGRAMRSFLDSVGQQPSETAERAFRAQLAADADDLVSRPLLVGDEESQALGRQAAEDALAIDALMTRFAEINRAKPEGARLAKLQTEHARIAEQEAKELARENARIARDDAREAKAEARARRAEEREAERARKTEERDAAREAKAGEREAAVEAERKRTLQEDAFKEITTMLGTAIGGAPGYFIGNVIGRLPKVVRWGKEYLDHHVSAAQEERMTRAVSRYLSSAAKGAATAARVAPMAAVGLSSKKHDEVVAYAQELVDPESDASRALMRKAARLDVVRPGMGAAYARTEISRAQFITSKLPARVNGVFGRPARLDPISERKFRRYVAAAYEPAKALDRISKRRGSPEDVETLRTLYPAMYQDFVRRTEDALRVAKKVPPYAERVRISYQTGIITDPSTDPAAMTDLQTVADGNAEMAREAIFGSEPQEADDSFKYRPRTDPNRVYAARTDQITAGA